MTPTVAQHRDQADGTVTVEFTAADKTWTETYPDRRTASIESKLVMFPGTSREWLEKMHTRPTRQRLLGGLTKDLLR